MLPERSVHSIPKRTIEQAVMRALTMEGEPIGVIEKARRRSGEESQRKFRDRPVWHNKLDLDRFVAEMLNLDISEVLGPKRKTSDFPMATSAVISKLRRAGKIRDWHKGTGVWRLAEKPHEPAQAPRPSMNGPPPTRDARGDAADAPTEESMRREFVNILAKGTKDNTYKFALARAILEYCSKKPAGGDDSCVITYDYLADRFLRYYWRQECVFKIRQTYDRKRTPRAVRAIREVFGSHTPSSFGKLKRRDIKRAKGMILESVFGHARSKTSLVVPKFQNVRKGQRSVSVPIFYEYDDDRKEIRLSPAAFEFFKRNYGVLRRAVLFEWTKFLERVNTMPRLMVKVEGSKTKRAPAGRYRELLWRHFEYCFYCNGKLEGSYTHVDHFIPWSYIFEDDLWNLVLACQDCNCKKSDSLAEEGFLSLLIERNSKHHSRIKELEASLHYLGAKNDGWERGIHNHYYTCMDYGFNLISLP